MKAHLPTLACLALAACGGPLDAEDLVTSRTYKRLVFEVDVVQGQAASPDALQTLRSQLDTLRTGGHLSKPDGTEVHTNETIQKPTAEADHAYTPAEVRELASAHRPSAKGSEAVVHVLYLDGHSADDAGEERVLGFALGHDLIAMFPRSIQASCQAVQPAAMRAAICALLESSVLIHETGHLFGLVNDGAPMQTAHQDVANGHHDTNSECIMHYLADRSAYATLVADRLRRNSSSTTSPLDSNCLADLSALQLAPR